MPKSADAFRTISEVADWLGVPAHVLRFWESKFSQVKPVKRAGGRRYYRPADMRLLGGIRKLLHDDGMTIKGVQKLLREQGIKHVAALSLPLDSDDDPVEIAATAPAAPETAKVLSFSRDDNAEDASPSDSDAASPASQSDPEEASPTETPEGAPVDTPAATASDAPPAAQPSEVSPPAASAPTTTESPIEAEEASEAPSMAEAASAEPAPQDAASDDSMADTAPVAETPTETPAETPTATLSEAPTDAADPAPEAPAPDPTATTPAPKRPAAPRPRSITLPDDPADTIAADPGPLSALSTLDRARLAGQGSDLSVLLDRVRRFPSTKANSRK